MDERQKGFVAPVILPAGERRRMQPGAGVPGAAGRGSSVPRPGLWPPPSGNAVPPALAIPGHPRPVVHAPPIAWRTMPPVQLAPAPLGRQKPVAHAPPPVAWRAAGTAQAAPAPPVRARPVAPAPPPVAWRAAGTAQAAPAQPVHARPVAHAPPVVWPGGRFNGRSPAVQPARPVPAQPVPTAPGRLNPTTMAGRFPGGPAPARWGVAQRSEIRSQEILYLGSGDFSGPLARAKSLNEQNVPFNLYATELATQEELATRFTYVKNTEGEWEKKSINWDKYQKILEKDDESNKITVKNDAFENWNALENITGGGNVTITVGLDVMEMTKYTKQESMDLVVFENPHTGDYGSEDNKFKNISAVSANKNLLESILKESYRILRNDGQLEITVCG